MIDLTLIEVPVERRSVSRTPVRLGRVSVRWAGK